jgi:hypothetical protein
MFEALCDRAIAARKMRSLAAFEIVAAIYNVNRDPEKRKEPFTALDFMPDAPREPEKQQTVDEMIAVLESVMGCGPNKGPGGAKKNG